MSAQQGSVSSTEHASDQTFSELLKKISDLYKGGKYRWLRLLLNDDHCSGDLLSKNDITGHFLFNQLQMRGYISNNPTDVDILIDIATITDHHEALRLITEFNNQYNEEISDSKYKRKPISEFRKKLFKALIANINPVAPMVLNYNELNGEEFDNIWDFVFKLERELLLTKDKKKMKRFANCLDPKAGAILLGEDDNPDAGTPMVMPLRTNELSRMDRIQKFLKARRKKCWYVCGVLLLLFFILEFVFIYASVLAGSMVIFIISILVFIVFIGLSFDLDGKYAKVINIIATIVTIIPTYFTVYFLATELNT